MNRRRQVFEVSVDANLKVKNKKNVQDDFISETDCVPAPFGLVGVLDKEVDSLLLEKAPLLLLRVNHLFRGRADIGPLPGGSPIPRFVYLPSLRVLGLSSSPSESVLWSENVLLPFFTSAGNAAGRLLRGTFLKSQSSRRPTFDATALCQGRSGPR